MPRVLVNKCRNLPLPHHILNTSSTIFAVKRRFLAKLILLAQFFLYIYTFNYRMQRKNMLASILFFFMGFVSMAQGATPPPPSAPDPPGAPIDSNIAILFCIALTFGIYKMYKLSKKKA